MMLDEKTRYIAVKGDKTQEMDLINALLALAHEEADFVLVARAASNGEVYMSKWSLNQNAP